jgi:hypothetical protein
MERSWTGKLGSSVPGAWNELRWVVPGKFTEAAPTRKAWASNAGKAIQGCRGISSDGIDCCASFRCCPGVRRQPGIGEYLSGFSGAAGIARRKPPEAGSRDPLYVNHLPFNSATAVMPWRTGRQARSPIAPAGLPSIRPQESGDTLRPKAKLSIRLPNHFSPCALSALMPSGTTR